MNSDDGMRRFFSIEISNDQIYAYLHVQEVHEAVEFTQNDLKVFLEKYKVVYGIHTEQLAEVVSSPRHFTNKTIEIARGIRPTPGMDGYWEFIYKNKKASEKTVEQTEKHLDLKSVQTLDNVKKGELLAIYHPAQIGLAGKTVTGEIIPSPFGKEAILKRGKNVVMNEDQTKLYATIDGMVSRREGFIHVYPIFEVNGDVDYKVGHIDFNGTVIVRGSVLPGFCIKANGDIRVIGTIEGADLEAVGSIETTEGIVGRNKGKIIAGESVKSSFAVDAWIEAGQDVLVTQSIMHSTVRAGRDVLCQSGNGRIVGGSVQAGGRIVARTIGNPSSTPTWIEAGATPNFHNELQETKVTLTRLDELAKKTETAILLLEQLKTAGRITPDQSRMLRNLKHTLAHTKDSIDGTLTRKEELENKMKYNASIEIAVEKVIYPGAKLTLNQQVKEINEAWRAVRFTLESGEISIGSYS